MKGGTWIYVQIYHRFDNDYREYWIHNRRANWFKGGDGKWRKGTFFPETEIKREVYGNVRKKLVRR